MAKNYKEMHKIFDVVSNKNTIVVVIRTMGNIVKINNILYKTPCKKILNNLEVSEYINDNMFDKVYYEKSTSALLKIEKDINSFWDIKS